MVALWHPIHMDRMHMHRIHMHRIHIRSRHGGPVAPQRGSSRWAHASQATDVSAPRLKRSPVVSSVVGGFEGQRGRRGSGV